MFPADPECLHGIEIFNGNPRHDSHNDLARALAEQAGLPGTAGSDFHQVQDLDSCCVGFEKLPGDGQELAEVIRQGRFTRRSSGESKGAADGTYWNLRGNA